MKVKNKPNLSPREQNQFCCSKMLIFPIKILSLDNRLLFALMLPTCDIQVACAYGTNDENIGSVPEWLKGTGCKPVGESLRWFESNPAHYRKFTNSSNSNNTNDFAHVFNMVLIYPVSHISSYMESSKPGKRLTRPVEFGTLVCWKILIFVFSYVVFLVYLGRRQGHQIKSQ
jgi:hypothetical protein